MKNSHTEFNEFVDLSESFRELPMIWMIRKAITNDSPKQFHFVIRLFDPFESSRLTILLVTELLWLVKVVQNHSLTGFTPMMLSNLQSSKLNPNSKFNTLKVSDSLIVSKQSFGQA